ncbi:hypothetical protein RvY_16190 [Ramazzottius varieornatus]|uniref:rhomboid protease n=1 Tax=Ramazzottius varieornatus TaxID=947166 RepID=A0A1D1W0J1_RAMVA|nr:hypothetical protein RvY_16190 [Ramazzottius varieornatus]
MIRSNLRRHMASASIYPYLGPNGSTFINNAMEENRMSHGASVVLDAERAADEHLENGHHKKDSEFERRWRGIFKMLDSSNTGKVPMAQLKTALQTNALKVPTNIQEKMLAQPAVHKDDHLDFHKFLRLVENVDRSAHLDKFRGALARTAYTILPKSHRAAFVESELKEYNCLPPPIFLLTISLVELAVFLYFYFTQSAGTAMDASISLNNTFIYSPYRRKEAWRLLSYMLVHAGWWHLTVNLLVQLFLGIPLELVHKYWRVAIVYLFGVIAGALGTSVTDPNVFLAGASGGVYALIAAHLASIIINWKQIDWNWLRLLCWFLLVGVDVGVAVYYRYFYSGPEHQNIGYTAHLSGALCGFLLGVVTLRHFRDMAWERVLWWICLSIVVAAFVFAIFWNIFWPKFPSQTV